MNGSSLRDVPGLLVGHVTDAQGVTGCTVVLATAGAVAGVDVRGSAPGTRETDLLRPTALVERVHAVLLAGGSAWGLAAAGGVMRWLEERGFGLATGPRIVPIVPGAVIFDCGLGDARAFPDTDDGYAACEAAAAALDPLEGSLGAGTGATVGKLAGPERATKGGIGTASVTLAGGVVVGALAVTNAIGNVVGKDGGVLGGVRRIDGPGFVPAEEILGSLPPDLPVGGNTTLAVIGTNAPLDRSACLKLAQLGHDALAIAIRPVHTMLDGDTVFVLSTGTAQPVPALELVRLGAVAVDVLAEAIRRSVLTANGLAGVPGLAG